MTNLKLDAAGDLEIVDNRLVLVTGADEIRQRWLIAVRTVLGEWFLDRNQGVPYVPVTGTSYSGKYVTDKRLIKREIQRIFADATRRVPGVIQVNEVTVGAVDPSTRFVEVSVIATIEDGTVLDLVAIDIDTSTLLFDDVDLQTLIDPLDGGQELEDS